MAVMTLIDVNNNFAGFFGGTSYQLYSGARTRIGQSITGSPNYRILNNIKIYLSKLGSPTGNAVIKIYAHTGTFGTNGLPTGAVLATSDNFDVSTLAVRSVQLTTFQFTSTNRIPLVDGTNYFFSLEYSGGDATNYIYAFASTGSYHAGNVASYTGGWSAISGYDLMFLCYGHNPAAISNSIDFQLENDIPITFNNDATDYVRAVLKVGGSTIETFDLGQVTSATLSPAGASETAMYALIPSATSSACSIEMKTYSDAGYTTQIGTTQTKTGTMTIDTVANAPTFTTFTMENAVKVVSRIDIHGNILGGGTGLHGIIGSNDRTAIYGYSKVRAVVSAANKMVAKNSATGSYYSFKVNENTQTGNYSGVGTVNLDIDPAYPLTNGTVTAYDSRGLSTTVSLDFLLIDHYTDVTLSALTLARTNLVEDETTLTVSGSWWKKYFGSDSTTPVGTENTLTAEYRWKRTNHEWQSLDGTCTMTIASPCVVTKSTHGLETGDVVYFTNSGGALPTGITASTNYFVIKIDNDTFNVATTKANALVGTKITTSGSQSGIHTLHGDSVWTTLAFTDTDGSLSFGAAIDGDTGANGFDVDYSYTIEVRIFDLLSDIISEATLPTGTPLLDYYRLNGTKGVAVGQRYDPLTSDASMLQVAGRVTADDPVNPQDLVTVKYLQESASFTQTYYTHASSVMSTTLTESSTADTETLDATPTDTMTLFYKTSVADTPTPFTLTAGTLIGFHFDANINLAGRKSTTLQFALFYVDADGTTNKTAIGDISDVTETLTTTQTHYELHAHVATGTTVPAGKRLWVELYANTTGALPYPIVSIYRDSIDYHIAFSIQGSVLNNFVQKSGDTMTGGLVLANISPTADGSIGFDRTGEDLQIGDGTNSQVVHMGAFLTSWTPTFTNLTVGSGTLVSRYSQYGKFIHGRIILIFAADTSISGDIAFTLPVTGITGMTAREPIGMATLYDSGTAVFEGMIVLDITNPTTKALVRTYNVAGTYPAIAALSNLIPFTWTTNDAIYLYFSYEAA